MVRDQKKNLSGLSFKKGECSHSWFHSSDRVFGDFFNAFSGSFTVLFSKLVWLVL